MLCCAFWCSGAGRRLGVALMGAWALTGVQAAPATQAQWPAPVQAALERAQLPRDAVSVWVADAAGGAPRLAHRAQVPMNPASVMKLVTTYAGLELLGPAYVWQTPVYIDGPVRSGTLHGNVYVRGQGDPKMVMERLWLLLRRLQGQGIRHIAGDIVLDQSAFVLPTHDPAAFDGEPLRPYNAAPDALLLNFKAVVLNLGPDQAAGVARVQMDPPLAGVQVPATVPLAPAGTACGDWRANLRADWSDAHRVVLRGAYPAACGERSWAVAYADPARYAQRAVEGMWHELGGQLTGTVRYGTVPRHLEPAWVATSPPLAEVVRDINKYSNNVMAQQLWLTLGWQQHGVGTPENAREAVRQWWRARWGDADFPAMDNGAGLSRQNRITAQSLARMLQVAWASPVMPELLASLPVTGVDGTLRRSRASARAHLKTGSLRDVAAIAGYVHAADGRRYVLVAVVNHAQAAAARPVFDALVEWTAQAQRPDAGSP